MAQVLREGFVHKQAQHGLQRQWFVLTSDRALEFFVRAGDARDASQRLARLDLADLEGAFGQPPDVAGGASFVLFSGTGEGRGWRIGGLGPSVQGNAVLGVKNA